MVVSTVDSGTDRFLKENSQRRLHKLKHDTQSKFQLGNTNAIDMHYFRQDWTTDTEMLTLHFILLWCGLRKQKQMTRKKNDACSLNPLTLQWLDDVAISYNTALAFFVTWSYKNTVTVCRIEFLQYSSVWCMAYIICTLPVGKISVQDILSWSAFPRRLFCRLQERLTERKITKT